MLKVIGVLLLVAYCRSYLIHDCVISSQIDSLYSNNLQFAYKSQTSTIQCVSSVIETITYYIDHDGNVYMCTLDASLKRLTV